ncbi:MAG: MarR family transcriptional regulator [Candidatus Caldatribacteriota bacterium]|nr:MarR family transcriptional regulator [Atribacterota bacterium]MDD3641677.1 MarR family transcriptional regulator [Atribacterota bacterium]MDI9596425.1 MarR family transcriptional regulator [Atribacterota bacterium]
MKELYDFILKLKDFCICNETKISNICNISMAELKSINAINCNEEITCTEFSERLSLSPSRGSRIIDNLVKKGFLIRKVKDCDRRSILLCLTEKGRRIKDEINQEQKIFEDEINSNLSTQEIISLKKGLKIFDKILENNKKGEKK